MVCSVCEICQLPAKQSCSSCHVAFYCSKECQKKGWKQHKSSCFPYEVKLHPVYGRYAVATRSIKAGEIIMRDSAIVAGPRDVSIPICLGCHKGINGTYTCSKCNFPLCSSKCEKSMYHELECPVLSRAKNLLHIDNFEKNCSAYECILPLRCLLMKIRDPNKWNIFSNLQDSVDLIPTIWRDRIKLNVIDYFKKYLNFRVDQEEIYRICGVLHINSIELKKNGQIAQGVFPKVAMMAHDCSPNAENIFDSSNRVIVRSTATIQKGSAITISYTCPFWTTLRRRNHLLETKYFECRCDRCSDPTELGTHIGTIICNHCGGHVSSTVPLLNDADWKCKTCNITFDSKNITDVQGPLLKALENKNRTKMEPLDDLIKLCKGKLHDNHQIPTQAKISWILFWGNHPEHKYKDMSISQLEKKIKYCRDLLDGILCAKTKFRGFMLYELHATLKVLTKKISFIKEYGEDYVDKCAKEAEERLKETKDIFYFENEMQEEGLEDKLVLLDKDLEVMGSQNSGDKSDFF